MHIVKVFRKVVIFVLVLVQLVGSCFAQSDGVFFSDVKTSAWYSEAVVFCTEKGIVNGTGDGSFSPELPINRAMLVVILGRAAQTHGVDLALSQYSDLDYFDDVLNDTWYAPYANWAYESGILFMVEDGKFEPYKAVKREEFALSLCIFLDCLEVYPKDPRDYPDDYIPINPKWCEGGGIQALWDRTEDTIQISEWALTPFATLTAYGLINRYPNGDYKPQNPITRAEICQVMMKTSQTYLSVQLSF